MNSTSLHRWNSWGFYMPRLYARLLSLSSPGSLCLAWCSPASPFPAWCFTWICAHLPAVFDMKVPYIGHTWKPYDLSSRRQKQWPGRPMKNTLHYFTPMIIRGEINWKGCFTKDHPESNSAVLIFWNHTITTHISQIFPISYTCGTNSGEVLKT